jgi:aminopeptidase N
MSQALTVRLFAGKFCYSLPMSRFLLSMLLLALLTRCDSGTTEPAPTEPAPGVALSLARERVALLSEVHYDLTLQLPAAMSEPVTGSNVIRFDLTAVTAQLVLDFRAPPEQVQRVHLDGEPVDYSLPTDHIVIPTSSLKPGPHRIDVDFVSTDTALNRQPDFLYALFVPDRASTALPVFDQPDLKARFTLTLEMPSEWQAVTNGAMLFRDAASTTRDVLRFKTTEPISTYLFAFAAGDLQVATAERDGRQFTLYHRETDANKLARNLPQIFDLQAASLAWLEDYTGIDYPFDKFEFFAVPAFQFGGMEHPGAIWYRASTLFLDPSASRTQELGRASLIAHESAHMWFGDLVTMEWFNDVWMKEVFANFMAAKIAGPAFPDLNLDLRFFQANHPAAYGVDRTPGTNPIRQQLDNLNDAGSLYGAIIYQKAPIVVRQLEALIGPDQLQAGLREYLSSHAYGNATWPDLIAILDGLTDEDLTAWSEVWVNATGRPRITTEWRDGGIHVRQSDPVPGRGLLWNQPIALAVSVGGHLTELQVHLQDAEAFVALESDAEPDFILAGADGLGYGHFVLDPHSRSNLLTNLQNLENPIHRAVVWQNLLEEVLEGNLASIDFITAGIRAVTDESDELVAQQMLGLLRHVYWQFLNEGARRRVSPSLEAALWAALERAPTAGRKGAYFNTLVSVTLSEAGIARLESLWRGNEAIEGLPLQEQQFTDLAEALALRKVPDAAAILSAQAERIENPDRRARFQFILPALGDDPAAGEALFQKFADVTVRRRESWVLEAQAALHHPLRNESALDLLRPSLDLTAEIQRTGDIFFPLSWLNATLAGYQSPEAAAIVQQYLDDNPDLPARLRGKVLQAADDLFRAASLGL